MRGLGVWAFDRQNLLCQTQAGVEILESFSPTWKIGRGRMQFPKQTSFKGKLLSKMAEFEVSHKLRTMDPRS